MFKSLLSSQLLPTSMQTVIANSIASQLILGLSQIMGNRSSASAVLSVPVDFYNELLGSVSSGSEELSFSLTLDVLPDPTLIGSGSILAVV